MTPQTDVLPVLVEDMLLDAGFGQDAVLRDTLLALGSLANLAAPQPGPELAALLSRPAGQLERRRRVLQRRTTALGLAIIAGMGLGVTGVAASSTGHGDSTGLSVQHLLQDWTPSWSIAPAASPPVAQEPAPSAGPAREPAVASAEAVAGHTGGMAELPAPGKVLGAKDVPRTKNEVPKGNAGSDGEFAGGGGKPGQTGPALGPAPSRAGKPGR
ncbi:hypothetical protein QFZ36_003202 [Pseudarthrobacter siccitolerans]|uniref:Uncharacterized protein n=1 Tax=Pseudarthrobacter siccitolerans TaxID=861266 RepID=A0ABU0PNT5_9MICC|nr:hypothetical protein [Pseudarthrobacter siccitolerans]MDQ0675641.1 hypothetical protein [Pseudarthrobacter siccitolerans]